jgi:hypothetical protein
MAKMSGKGGKIEVDDSGGTLRDISADVEGWECIYESETPEVTGMGEGSRNYVNGIPLRGVTLKGVKWNTAATTGSFTVLKGIVGSTTSKTVKVTPEGTGNYYSGEFLLKGMPSSGDIGGALMIGDVEFMPMGAVAADWGS